MSTASPDTCGDVSGVATHRAASAREPYVETASSSRCSWYAGERQPLLTWSSTPSSAASVAACGGHGEDPDRGGNGRDVVAETVVPSGTTPSASQLTMKLAIGTVARS